MKLEIKNLSVGYETGVVLNHLNLNVAEGEFLSLLGPSGCGKTTLMKAIAGILPVREGTVHLDGRDITNLPIHRRGTVILFQDMRLFPHQSVAENVAFPLKMQGVPKAERLAKAEVLLEKVQLAGFGNRRPSELSGGQQQRVALARALAARPKLLLLDEPFSALDENLREDMRALVLQLQKEFSMTVILVTHDREEALSMSDQVALLFDGKIAQIGTPRQVYHQPASRRVADYFGNCVYLPGRVENGQFTLRQLRCPVSVPDGQYEMMLRPDSLILDDSGNYHLTVETVSFRGTDTLLILRAEDGTLWKKSALPTVHWKPGDHLRASIQTQQAVLMPVQSYDEHTKVIWAAAAQTRISPTG